MFFECFELTKPGSVAAGAPGLSRKKKEGTPVSQGLLQVLARQPLPLCPGAACGPVPGALPQRRRSTRGGLCARSRVWCCVRGREGCAWVWALCVGVGVSVPVCARGCGCWGGVSACVSLLPHTFPPVPSLCPCFPEAILVGDKASFIPVAMFLRPSLPLASLLCAASSKDA